MTTLLSAVLPDRSRTVTLNTCVVDGARSRTVAERYPIRSAPYGLPSARSVYQTWLLTLSVDCVQESEIRVGNTVFTLSVGAVGGAVSGGVV